MTTQPEIDPKHIAELRKRTGMSQKDLAARLGVDPTTVTRWEQGDAKPTGTAAVILKAAITATVMGVAGASLLLACLPAFGVYQMLKGVFEEGKKPEDEDDLGKTDRT